VGVFVGVGVRVTIFVGTDAGRSVSEVVAVLEGVGVNAVGKTWALLRGSSHTKMNTPATTSTSTTPARIAQIASRE
jgi:hypothetical protein